MALPVGKAISRSRQIGSHPKRRRGRPRKKFNYDYLVHGSGINEDFDDPERNRGELGGH